MDRAVDMDRVQRGLDRISCVDAVDYAFIAGTSIFCFEEQAYSHVPAALAVRFVRIWTPNDLSGSHVKQVFHKQRDMFHSRSG